MTKDTFIGIVVLFEIQSQDERTRVLNKRTLVEDILLNLKKKKKKMTGTSPFSFLNGRSKKDRTIPGQ